MPRPTLPPDVVGISKIVGKFRECAWQGKYRSAQRYHAQVRTPKTPGLESTTGLPASIYLAPNWGDAYHLSSSNSFWLNLIMLLRRVVLNRPLLVDPSRPPTVTRSLGKGLLSVNGSTVLTSPTVEAEHSRPSKLIA